MFQTALTTGDDPFAKAHGSAPKKPPAPKPKLGYADGFPVLAIGPKGGKIIGWKNGTPIYAGSKSAKALAKAKKVKKKTADPGKETLAEHNGLIDEWLTELGLKHKGGGYGNTFVMNAVDAQKIMDAFPDVPVIPGPMTKLQATGLWKHVGQPLVPKKEELVAWAAKAAAGGLENPPFSDAMLATLKDAGSLGGSHGGRIVTDKKGTKYAWKTNHGHVWVSRAEEAFNRVAKLVFPEKALYPDAELVEHDGKKGVLLEWVDNVGTLGSESSGHSAPTAKVGKHFESLVQHQVLDWLMSNHDSHGANFVVTKKGELAAIDKGQAFKDIGNDKLSASYKLNASAPIYNEMWKAFQAGEISGDPVAAVTEVLHSIEKNLSLEQYHSMVLPYLEELSSGMGVNPDKKWKAIEKRFTSLRSDFEAFLSEMTGKVVIIPPASAEAAPAHEEIESPTGKVVDLVQKPGWPITKLGVTVHHPGNVPGPNVKWPSNYPGPGYHATVMVGGKDASGKTTPAKEFEFVFGQDANGKLEVSVEYPGAKSHTFDSVAKAADSVSLWNKGLDLDMSGKEKKAKGIAFSASKLLKLNLFKDDFADAAATTDAAPGAMSVDELMGSLMPQLGIAPAKTEITTADMLAAIPDGPVTDMSSLPHAIQEAADNAEGAETPIANWETMPPVGSVVKLKVGGTSLVWVLHSDEGKPSWQTWGAKYEELNVFVDHATLVAKHPKYFDVPPSEDKSSPPTSVSSIGEMNLLDEGTVLVDESYSNPVNHTYVKVEANAWKRLVNGKVMAAIDVIVPGSTMTVKPANSATASEVSAAALHTQKVKFKNTNEPTLAGIGPGGKLTFSSGVVWTKDAAGDWTTKDIPGYGDEEWSDKVMANQANDLVGGKPGAFFTLEDGEDGEVKASATDAAGKDEQWFMDQAPGALVTIGAQTFTKNQNGVWNYLEGDGWVPSAKMAKLALMAQKMGGTAPSDAAQQILDKIKALIPKVKGKKPPKAFLDNLPAGAQVTFDYPAGPTVMTKLADGKWEDPSKWTTTSGMLLDDKVLDVGFAGAEAVAAAPPLSPPPAPPAAVDTSKVAVTNKVKSAGAKKTGPLPVGHKHTLPKDFTQEMGPDTSVDVELEVLDGAFGVTIPGDPQKKFKSLSAASDYCWLQQKGYDDKDDYKKKTGKKKVPSGGGWKFWGVDVKLGELKSWATAVSTPTAPAEVVSGQPGWDEPKVPTPNELVNLPEGSKLLYDDGKGWVKLGEEWYPIDSQVPHPTGSAELAMDLGNDVQAGFSGVSAVVPQDAPTPEAPPGPNPELAWEGQHATTLDELNALPVGTTVQTDYGQVYKKLADGDWMWATSAHLSGTISAATLKGVPVAIVSQPGVHDVEKLAVPQPAAPKEPATPSINGKPGPKVYTHVDDLPDFPNKGLYQAILTGNGKGAETTNPGWPSWCPPPGVWVEGEVEGKKVWFTTMTATSKVTFAVVTEDGKVTESTAMATSFGFAANLASTLNASAGYEGGATTLHDHFKMPSFPAGTSYDNFESMPSADEVITTHPQDIQPEQKTKLVQTKMPLATYIDQESVKEKYGGKFFLSEPASAGAQKKYGQYLKFYPTPPGSQTDPAESLFKFLEDHGILAQHPPNNSTSKKTGNSSAYCGIPVDTVDVEYGVAATVAEVAAAPPDVTSPPADEPGTVSIESPSTEWFDIQDAGAIVEVAGTKWEKLKNTKWEEIPKPGLEFLATGKQVWSIKLNADGAGTVVKLMPKAKKKPAKKKTKTLGKHLKKATIAKKASEFPAGTKVLFPDGISWTKQANGYFDVQDANGTKLTSVKTEAQLATTTHAHGPAAVKYPADTATMKPAPMPMQQPKAAPTIDPVLVAQAKAYAAWTKTNPKADAKTAKVLAFLQADLVTTGFAGGLYAHAGAMGEVLVGSDNWEGFKGKLPGPVVDTPLGKAVRVKVSELEKLYPASKMKKGKDGKMHPVGTTFAQETVTTKTVKDVIQGSLSTDVGKAYKMAPHMSDPDKTILKFKGIDEAAQKAALEFLKEYGLKPSGDPMTDTNTVHTVSNAELATSSETETQIVATEPAPPAPFTQAPLPFSLGPQSQGDVAVNNEGDLGALDSFKMGHWGHSVRHGGPGLWTNSQVNVRKVSNPGGEDFYEVTGDLLEFEPTTSKLSKGTVKYWCKDGDYKPYDEKTGMHRKGDDVIEQGWGGYVGKTAGGSEVSVCHNNGKKYVGGSYVDDPDGNNSNETAMRNRFTVRVPVSKDVQTELQTALMHAGVSPELAASSHDDAAERIFIKVQIARMSLGTKGYWGQDRKNYANEAWLDKTIEAHGNTHLVDTAEIRVGAGGAHTVWTDRFKGESWFEDVHFLHTGNPSAESVFGVVAAKTGVPSRKQGYTNGTGGSTYAQDEDTDSGGASGIMTRIAGKGITHSGGVKNFGGAECRIFYHPRVLQRANYWHHTSDSYGRQTGAGHEQGDLVKDVTGHSGSHETTFEEGIAHVDIAGVWNQSQAERQASINAVKATGETHVNGIPLEDFFFTGKDNYQQAAPKIKANVKKMG